MAYFQLAAELGSCGSAKLVMRSPLDLVQFAGELLIPAAAIWIVAIILRRHPTDVPRYTSERITKLLDRPAIRVGGLVTLAAGLLIFGVSIFLAVDGGADCAKQFAVVPALGMLITLCGAMVVGLAWASKGQAGWVLLATFFALDLWIVFGMVMMHLKSMPDAPDAMLMLAFVMHAILHVPDHGLGVSRPQPHDACADSRGGGRPLDRRGLGFPGRVHRGELLPQRERPVRFVGGRRGAVRADPECSRADDGQWLHEIPRGHGRAAACRSG